ncbi:MAG: hypothetical protein H8F28_17725 [Fibrella sp.]|nr:hypothetical protein [Armatimonadota bacterium]
MSNAIKTFETRHLLRQFAVALILFALINVSLRHLARNVPGRATVRKITTNASPVKTLLFGNSLIAAGINEAEFVASGPALNVGIGASTLVEHLLILHRIKPGQYDQPTVVEGFFDFQLMETPPPTLVGNRALSYYENPALAARYYYPRNPVEQSIFQFYGYLPFFTERSDVWAKVEKLRREIAQLDMPRLETNRFGRVDDFNALEAGTREQFRQECVRLLRENAPLTPEVRDFIAKAKALGGRAIFVEMPMSLHHRSTYYDNAEWLQLRKHQQEALRKEGAEYVNASDWITDEKHFADHLHLNSEGATRFSRQLDAYLKQGKVR